MENQQGEPQAKLVWLDPYSGETREYPLHEGASATVGRSASNDIQIAEGHVSRLHAVITCRDGSFIIDDLESANGTYVNGDRIAGSSTVAIGDEIHLFVSMLKLIGVNSLPDDEAAEMVSVLVGDRATLRITNGPQKGQTFALLKEELYIGRSTPNSTWEIALQDPTVSRPHAFLVKEKHQWKLFDLGSVNGTAVNSRPVTGGKAQTLRDGDRIMVGATATVFRIGYPAAQQENNKHGSGRR